MCGVAVTSTCDLWSLAVGLGIAHLLSITVDSVFLSSSINFLTDILRDNLGLSVASSEENEWCLKPVSEISLWLWISDRITSPEVFLTMPISRHERNTLRTVDRRSTKQLINRLRNTKATVSNRWVLGLGASGMAARVGVELVRIYFTFDEDRQGPLGAKASTVLWSRTADTIPPLRIFSTKKEAKTVTKENFNYNFYMKIHSPQIPWKVHIVLKILRRPRSVSDPPRGAYSTLQAPKYHDYYLAPL